MKKLLIVAIVTTFVSSCKKDYTCECTETSGGTSSVMIVKGKASKKDADAWCKSNEKATIQVLGITQTNTGVTCTVK